MTDDARARGSAFRESADSASESYPDASNLRPNCKEAIDFLQWFRPEGPWYLVAFRADKRGPPAGKKFDAANIKQLEKWVQNQNRTSNIYFHVNSVRPNFHAEKAKKGDIERVEFLHVDIDPAHDKPLHQEQKRILHLLTDKLPQGVPPPTALVFSGGGYQAFWRLAEPISVYGNATECDRVESCNRELERILRGDNCHNIDRIMRLPGTVNLPDEKKKKKGRVPALANLVEYNAIAHPLSAFPKPAESTRRKQSNGQEQSFNARRVRFDDLDKWGVPERVKIILLHGRHPDEPKEGDDSRSAWLFDAVCNLVRCNVDDDVIYSVITDPDFKISESVRDKGPGAEAYAAKQIAKAKEKVALDAETFVKDSKDNIVAASQQNIRVALRELGARLRYDCFQDRMLVDGVDGVGPLLNDNAISRLWLSIDERFRFRPNREFFETVVCDLARQAAFHPVRDYLDGLSWDGTLRIDTWLSRYGGAEDSAYTRAVGAITLIAAVRRVRQPGCKFDEMLLLEGSQGTNKSSALAILAYQEDWFSDDLPLSADTKRVIEAIQGRWIVEAAELKGMRNSDVEHMKSLLSRRVDRARLAYARLTTDVPRQGIFIGTTNSASYLRDGSGNRRFWPVSIANFDIEALQRDRDQLWAEAAVREARGDTIRLDRNLYGDAAKEQEMRRIEDPFVSALKVVLGDLRGKLRREDALRVLGIPVGQREMRHSERLAEAMRELGWERVKLRFGKTNPEWCFARGSPAERKRRIVTSEAGNGKWEANLEGNL